MKKFEYKIVNVPFKKQSAWAFGDFSEEKLMKVLQEQGEEGWELVQVLPYTQQKDLLDHLCLTVHLHARFVFKRETNP